MFRKQIATIFSQVVLFGCLVFSFSVSVFSEEEVVNDEAMKKGIYHFRQERYDEALAIFKESFEKDKTSSLAAYYTGLTLKRMESYIEAEQYLIESLGLTPRIKGALIELIDLLYRLDKTDEAKKWIAVAEEEGIRPAQAKFLKGLTLQKSGEYDSSITAFKEAKELDDRLAQSSDYQIGVCYMKMDRFKDAQSVFRDVLAIDPYSDIAGYANQYINALERRLERDKPFHFLARTAWEYDSNVILKPTEASLISDVTEQSDTREVGDIRADYTVRTDDNRLSLKTAYGFHISKQNDFGAYDILGNSLSAQGNVSFDKMMVTFPVNYSHTMVDEKNYLSSVSAGNINNISIGNSQMMQLGAIYNYDDYLRPQSSSDEDRSGNELTGTAGWFWFFSKSGGFVNLRCNINKDWPEGVNWEYWGTKAGATILYPFWDKFKLSVSGEFFLQDFENTHTVFGKERNDQTYTAGALFSYEIVKNLELQVGYTFVKQQSNIGIYEYDRHIASAGAQFSF